MLYHWLKNLRPERSDERFSRSAVEGQVDIKIYYLETLSFDCAPRKALVAPLRTKILQPMIQHLRPLKRNADPHSSG